MAVIINEYTCVNSRGRLGLRMWSQERLVHTTTCTLLFKFHFNIVLTLYVRTSPTPPPRTVVKLSDYSYVGVSLTSLRAIFSCPSFLSYFDCRNKLGEECWLRRSSMCRCLLNYSVVWTDDEPSHECRNSLKWLWIALDSLVFVSKCVGTRLWDLTSWHGLNGCNSLCVKRCRNCNSYTLNI